MESVPAEPQPAAAEEAPKEEAVPEVAESAPVAEAPKEEKVEDVTGKGEVSPATAFDDTPISQGVVGENHVVASNPVDQTVPSADSQSRNQEDDVEKVVDEEVDSPSSGDIQEPAEDAQIQDAAITSAAIADDTPAAVESDKTGDDTLNDNDQTTTTTNDETTGKATVADHVEATHEEDRGTDSADDFVLEQKNDVDSSDSTGPAPELLAEGAAVAGGSLLVAAAVAEAVKESGEDRDHVSQADVFRDISEGVPTEPSARDLPPSYSPSPDAAMTVEPAKKLQSAGSQYGTFQTEQTEAQQASPGEDERERSESSASPKLKGAMVKDEGVASKPNPLSTTSGKLTILASMALGVYAVFKLANGGSRYP